MMAKVIGWEFSGERPCGDVNNSLTVNIIDISYIIAFLYQGGPAPLVEQSAEIDGNGAIKIVDITELIGILYLQAPPSTCGL